MCPDPCKSWPASTEIARHSLRHENGHDLSNIPKALWQHIARGRVRIRTAVLRALMARRPEFSGIENGLDRKATLRKAALRLYGAKSTFLREQGLLKYVYKQPDGPLCMPASHAQCRYGCSGRDLGPPHVGVHRGPLPPSTDSSASSIMHASVWLRSSWRECVPTCVVEGVGGAASPRDEGRQGVGPRPPSLARRSVAGTGP